MSRLFGGDPIFHNAKPLREKCHKKKTTQKVFHKKLKSLSNLEFNALKKNSKQQNN